MTSAEAIAAINAAANRREAAEIRDKWIWANGDPQTPERASVCDAVMTRWGEAMIGPPSEIGKPTGD